MPRLRARGHRSRRATNVTPQNKLRSLIKGTGPETDITLGDLIADPAGFAAIALLILAALLA